VDPDPVGARLDDREKSVVCPGWSRSTVSKVPASTTRSPTDAEGSTAADAASEVESRIGVVDRKA
jgi:hypothetical protein